MVLFDRMWDEIVGGPRPCTSHQETKPGLMKSASMGVPGVSTPRSLIDRSASMSSAGDSPLPSPSETSGQWERMEDRRRSLEVAKGEMQARHVADHIAMKKQPLRVDTSVAHSLPTASFLSGGFSPLGKSPGDRKDENVWRSVFHPGSNKAGMDKIGSGKFDKAVANGPSVYDWYNPLTV